MFAGDKWREFKARYKGRDDCLFLGMGDYQDFLSTSERDGLRRANLHDSSWAGFIETEEKKVKEFAKEIEWMGDNLIGLHEGNHYFEFPDGTTSTQRLCGLLRTKYLGVTSIVGLKLTRNRDVKWLYIRSHHGTGGGQTVGGAYNRLEKEILSWGCQLVLQGHSHDLGCVPMVRMNPLHCPDGTLDIEEEKILLCRTGSFLKGYERGKRGYIADIGGRPKMLGAPEIEVMPIRVMEPFDHLTYELRGTA